MPSQLRILHIAAEYPPLRIGGISTYLDNLIRALPVHIESAVAVLVGRNYQRDPAEAGQARQFSMRLDVEALSRLPLGVLRKHDVRGVDVAEVSREHWDLLHVHDWYGVVHALRLQLDTAVPFVMSSHLPLRYGFTYSDHPAPLTLKMRLEALGLRTARKITASSQEISRLLQIEYNATADRIEVVPNGVDAVHFHPGGGDGARRTPRPTLVAVGRLTEQKGLDLLTRIFKSVRAQVPAATLVVAGDGPLRPELFDLCRAHGVAASTELMGYVPHHELPDVYRAADVFLSTAVFEPFGLTTLEAMACGLPVVVSPLGGVGDFVRDGIDGYIRYPQQWAAFAASIVRLLRDDRLRSMMGEAARERAELYPWRRTADLVAKMYEGALASNG